jgi:hypothetical protein
VAKGLKRCQSFLAGPGHGVLSVLAGLVADAQPVSSSGAGPPLGGRIKSQILNSQNLASEEGDEKAEL